MNGFARTAAVVICPHCDRRPVRSQGRCLTCWRRAIALGVITRVRPGVGGRPAQAGEPCRACNRRVRSRPRGLCWGCYLDPATRARFPSQSRFSRLTARPADWEDRPEWRPADPDALTDAEIARLPVPPPACDRDVPPPPQAAPARDWDRWPGLGRADDGLDLHPSTLPAAIARDQRRAVRQALAELGPGAAVEVLSAAVVLPVDVVRRRLAELNPAETPA